MPGSFRGGVKAAARDPDVGDSVLHVRDLWLDWEKTWTKEENIISYLVFLF